MKGNPMKMIKHILMLAAAASLLAGCASDQGAGAMGNDSQTGYGNGQNAPATSTNAPNGPNGSISRSNPFGIGGTGSESN
jgi:hypothetical protein